MVRGTRNLTKLGFRRDVRLFLSALVGFLVLLVVVLVIMLESFVARAELVQHERWQAIADAIATRIERADPAVLRSQLEEARSRYHLASITVGSERAGSAAGETVIVDRVVPAGEMRIAFDSRELAATRRAGRLTVAISTAAAGLGLVLLFLYLPRIVDPVERLLDEAGALGTRDESVDETRYLVDTFRSTIETMKQQKLELEMLHERQRLRASDLELLTGTLTRSLSSGFIALDPTDVVVDLNAAAREILGIEDAATGSSLTSLLPGSEFTDVVTRAVEAGASLSRVEIAHQDKLIGLATVPLVSERGTSLGTMLLFTDVTEVRRLEEQLRSQQALADLGEMSTGIAHEFRNALSTILGYLRLARRVELPADALARVTAAEVEATSLSSSVDALLRFARPMQLVSEDVALRELLEEILTRFRQRHEQIAFTLKGPASLTIAGDGVALRTCFENLLRNAAEAVGERPGHVDVAIETGADVRVVIRDDGVGIDPAEIQRLLLPFQSNRPGGVGLGLPLANKIAILHGGSLTLTAAPGQGVEVVVSLPHSNRASTATKSNSPEPPGLSPFRANRA